MLQSRMKSPALTLPGAAQALQALHKATQACDLPGPILELVHLRVGQINGCSVCVDMHARALKAGGEPDARIFAVAAWREAPYYTEPERAALALAEATTRVSDRPEPVSDEVWAEASRHFNEAALGGLVMAIALANLWNRLNAATRQVGGEWVAQYG